MHVVFRVERRLIGQNNPVSAMLRNAQRKYSSSKPVIRTMARELSDNTIRDLWGKTLIGFDSVSAP